MRRPGLLVPSSVVAGCVLAVWLAPAAFGQESAPPPPTEPTQSWVVRNLIGLIILGLSFYMGALVVWMFLNFRRGVAIPETLLRELDYRLERRRFAQAYELLVADRSHFGQVLAAGVRRLPAGTPAAHRAMELANEQAVLGMEQRASYLATVATLGPMLGLLGTVYGMILSFGVISRAGATPQAGELAGGIATALVATLEGIAVAVPAITFYAIFRNRIDGLSLDVQIAAEGLLERFTPALRTPHPLAAAATARTNAPSWPALPYRDEPHADDSHDS